MAFRFSHEAESRAPDLPGLHSGLAEVYKQTGHRAICCQSVRVVKLS